MSPEGGDRPGFLPLPAPTRAEMAVLTRGVARKVKRALRRRGLLDAQTVRDAADQQPELRSMLAESAARPRARVVDPSKARPATDPTWLGAVEGVNLHAGVALGALDRAGRERLCRYLLRPPLSDDRLTERPDGRVELALKTPWRDGSPSMVGVCPTVSRWSGRGLGIAA